MVNLGQGGIAAVPALIAVAVVAAGTVGTPVAVDIADVNPDHPLYGLERIGEKIRMVSDTDQMKERWSEYAQMVERGKGLRYREILEEFREKLDELAPGDVAARREIVEWMQEQMPGIGRVQLGLQKEFASKLKERLSNRPGVPPEVQEKIENYIKELENLELENLELENLRTTIQAKAQEKVRARLQLMREMLENIVEEVGEKEFAEEFLNIDNAIGGVDEKIGIELALGKISPTENFEEKFKEKLGEFDNLLAEVQVMLGGAPENTHGRRACERLVDVSIELREKAVTAYENSMTRAALGLLHAAEMKLRAAKLILEHADEWEHEATERWHRWHHQWENQVKPIWENLRENIAKQLENLRELRERWRKEMTGKVENFGGQLENLERQMEALQRQHVENMAKEIWKHVEGKPWKHQWENRTKPILESLQEKLRNMEEQVNKLRELPPGRIFQH